ncbi:P-loop NTPase fold protein [Serratia rubidaea]|uniref:P-loop NTPase fold protein n=1 Tax=Serratia rubidaea TaxID=61652 RepID=UPI001F2032DC|nr:P-loop NTPase fold protein [Serratia rubidaea]
MQNRHIIEAIDYYCKLNSPGYAILLTGDWGAGKTYLVKNNLQPYTYIYVSLFGLSSLDDIYASVYNAMHPRKGKIKKFTNNIKDTEVGFSGFTVGLGNMTNGLANSIMRENVEKNKIIIFDDLERSCITSDQILGAINKYVEHHGCRVIAIAHDEKLGSALTETKEKIIGLSLRVTPDIPSTFKTFTADFRFTTLKSIFEEKFIEIFIASDCKSLRVLKHTLEDCVRLLDGLDNEIKENRDAIIAVLSIFLALDIEVRTGTLKSPDLIKRDKQISGYYLSTISMNNQKDIDNVPVPPLYISGKKYKPIDLTSNLLSDNDLINTLINGYYNFDELNKSIFKSHYFFEVKNTPSWATLYSLDILSDEDLKETLAIFNDEFKSRHYTSIGEILHVFHLMFLLSNISESPLTFDEVENECIKYIDDLVKNSLLPTIKEDNFLFQPFNDSYGSFGFWTLEPYKERTEKIRNYILLQQNNVFKSHYKTISKDLIELLRNDPVKFCHMISYSYSNKGEYLENDVLSSISPIEFINAWLSSPRIYWQNIKDSLENRYAGGRLQNSLASEEEWLKKIIDELKNRIASSRGFESYRIQRVLPHALINALKTDV